jgi:FAD/FMN-containing dehydrogenase
MMTSPDIGTMTSPHSGEPPALSEATARELRGALRGELVLPGDAGYEEARSVWNGMVDRRPAAVVRCAGTADVAAAVNVARQRGLALAVRCGAHSTAGYSTCDGGIVIDLRPMNTVRVDPQARTARVGGGALWAELDVATMQHELAVTGGRVSDTGVAGLALGSGSGWLERMFGFTCESMISAEVVTAAAEVVRASQAENPDLFWGLRGGGGNFGVVTEFEFRLHPVGPLLTAGLLLWPRARAGEVIRFYRDYMASAPDEAGGAVAFLTAPPAPFVPPELQGQPAVGVVYCYIGPLDDGQQHARALRTFGSPPVDMIAPMPYTALQKILDLGFPHGVREYFKVDWLRSLPDKSIDTLVAVAGELPAPFGQLILCPLGGAVSRSAAADMALSAIDAPWLYFCLPMWMDPGEDERNITWARRLAASMRDVGVGTTMANFVAEDEAGRLRASYGEQKYARLVEVKRRWDPGNLFRLNQNINPAQDGHLHRERPVAVSPESAAGRYAPCPRT